MHKQLNYLFGQPTATGLLRNEISDFKVFEKLPFSPCGEGEHLFIHIRKTGANTLYVARELAKYFQVKEMQVTYAGLKDRFAVTEQWFGVHVPGKTQYDLSDVSIEGVEILSYQRHNKKLKSGALSGNQFEIKLTQVTELDEIARRWTALSQHGVPNYFGEQRFGIDGGNIAHALALFAGRKVKDKKKRGMYLSAARSCIFNHLVSERISQERFDKLATGDVAMLGGTQSVFIVEQLDETIKQRLLEKDIDITAPMWGAGELMSRGQINCFEKQAEDTFPEFCQGLPRFGLKQERRKIRLTVTESSIVLDKENKSVTLRFFLPAGCYATTVLREVLDYTDMTERVVKSD